VIYTSGSTGHPKGVVIPHRGLVNYVWAERVLHVVGIRDRVLQFSSLSFDVSAEEIFPCLALGATLVLRTEFVGDSVPAFLEACEAMHTTIVHLPTGFWHEWVGLTMQSGPTGVPSALRLVIIGGETARPELAAAWRRSVGDAVEVVNGYGATEATVLSTIYRLSEWTGGRSTGVPVGRPIPNVEMHVLDRHLNAVPVGVPGEIYIAGEGVGRAYLHRPDLTAERFLPDPTAIDPGRRLYRTGDLGRYLPDGDLEFLGRLDHQLKIRGYRVELGELEALLARHPAVREAVVVADVAPSEGTRLVAYVVPDGKNAVSQEELVRHLRSWVPQYMMPSAFVRLDGLPLSPNGKIDRRRLPQPARHDAGRYDAAPPSNHLEQQLLAIWGDILNLEGIGIHDHFFELGGHSLLASRVVARIQAVFHVHVPLREFFVHPTVAGLAALVENLREREDRTDAPIAVERRRRGIPLSELQASDADTLIRRIYGE
jgi:amino acid adenylation domain-containing protein